LQQEKYQIPKKGGIIVKNKRKIIGIGRVIWRKAALLTLMLIVLGCFVLSCFFNQSAQAFHTKCHITGGGNFICAQDQITKVTFSVDVYSNFFGNFNKLEVIWTDPVTGVEHHFKEKNFKTGSCYNDSTVLTNTNDGPCNTCDYIGNGDLDGIKASFMLSLQDWGEPGNNDKATIVIISGDNTFLGCTSATGPFNGNIQARKERFNQTDRNIVDQTSP
jgi:hypothetical protein